MDELKPEDLSFSAYPEPIVVGMHVGMPKSVLATHLPTGIKVVCNHYRSQHQNRDACLRAIASALNTRAASGGLNEPFGKPEQFDVNEPSGDSRQFASLEQRADDLFWSLMQAPYADTTIGNIVCAETTPQRLESAWVPLLTAALANQQGVGGWQPIETAPKDGTRVLLAWDGVRVGYYLDNSRTGRAWAGWKVPSMEPWPSSQPTHWRPMPEPPTQPAGDVGRQG